MTAEHLDIKLLEDYQLEMNRPVRNFKKLNEMGSRIIAVLKSDNAQTC